jgi:Spy/CpxP family protein refolding chaperone
MSTDTHTPAEPPRRRSRWRTILGAVALLVTGGVIGAVATAPTFGQGWGPYGWHRGYDDDGPRWRDREYGPRGWRDDGPRWRDERRGWRDDDRRGWRDDGHGGMHRGGFMPGRIERMVDRALWSVDASREQRDKIAGIVDRTADDLFAMREKHLEGRRQIRDALAAATVDRDRIEALRTEQMMLADAASKRITGAFADAAEVLTPEQRSTLARRIERWQRWFRG